MSHLFDAKAFWRDNLKLRYLVIGAWNTLVGYGIFAGLYLAFSQATGYVTIAVVSHVLAVTHSFATQRWIVFRSSGNVSWEFFRFHITHLASLAIGVLGLSLLVEIAHLAPLVAQALITVFVVFASYFLHQHFTFRKAGNA